MQGQREAFYVILEGLYKTHLHIVPWQQLSWKLAAHKPFNFIF